MTFNQDGDSRRDNKHECFNGATEGLILPQKLAIIATQMRCERVREALVS